MTEFEGYQVKEITIPQRTILASMHTAWALTITDDHSFDGRKHGELCVYTMEISGLDFEELQLSVNAQSKLLQGLQLYYLGLSAKKK